MFRQLEFLLFPPSISSAEASPARTFPPRESAPALPEIDPASGSSTPESSTRCAPPVSSSKTSPRGNKRGCPVCNTTSCPLATASRPGALELQTWGHLTAACGPLSLPWATPTVNGNANRAGLSPRSGDGLRTQALWPTPMASTSGSNRGEGGAGRVGPVRPSLAGCVSQPGRALSARWVEVLMGFPDDWTAIDGPPVGGKRSAKRSRRARRKGARSRTTERG